MASLTEPADGRRQATRGARPGASAEDWLARAVVAVERHWRWALGLLLALDAALLLYMGRGTTFFFDDWDFVIHDYGGGLHSLLLAHVGNISIFPVAVYKVLFHVVGLDDYGAFRLVVIALHLIAAALIFTLASRRVERLPALLATALILFLGAAWEDLLWAFQVGYLLSIVGGLAAFVLIERRDRLGDVSAMAALILSIGSSSLGIPLVVGVVVELVWARDWRRLWLVVVPALLYFVWYLGYGESEITSSSLINAPGFAADLAAAAAGALVGRALEWGRPLAVLGLLVVAVRLIRPGPISPRLAGLLSTAVMLWIVTATARSTTSAPETSRYVYLGAVAIVLIGVELLRGSVVPVRASAVAMVLVVLAALTGLTVMHNGAAGLRSTSQTLAAELGAVQIAAAYVPAELQPDPSRAPQIVAGPYLHTVQAIGSAPGDTPSELIATDPASRTSAESLLIKLEGVSLAPAGAGLERHAALTPPLLAGVNGSPPKRLSRCWTTTAVNLGSYTEFVLPERGLLVRATGQPVDVTVRRFSPPPSGVDLGAVAPHGRSLLKVPRDGSGRPWFARVSSGAPSEVCGVG
jgi:hypothetical protein